MSTIHPDLPAVRPVAASPVANAQAAFFKAALAQVQSAPAQASQPEPRQAPTAVTGAAGEPVRTSRPGSLLDIRV